MKRTSRRIAECGCEVDIHTHIGDEGTVIDKVGIVGPCPEHSRGDAIISRFENVAATLRDRISDLDGRVFERFSRFDEIPGQWSLEWDQPGRKQFITLRQLLDDLAIRLISVEHHLEGQFGTRIHALEKTMKSVTMNQADFEQHRGRTEERLASLEQVAASAPRAGHGYREIPAGERGEGVGTLDPRTNE